MLAMFCIRACSRLVGCRTATRALSLHSFPGITVAQVGLWYCVHVRFLCLNVCSFPVFWVFLAAVDLCGMQVMLENLSSKFSQSSSNLLVYLMCVID